MDLSGLVLWADDALLVANKPAGLPTLPDGWNPKAAYLKGLLEGSFGRLWTVHRLDRDTSGVLVLARNAAAHKNLNQQFERRQVTKIYHAIVTGLPEWETKSVNLPLLTNVGHKHRTVVNSLQGKPAQTGFRILERFEAYSLVEAIPHTGRTHQIRAHLSALGYPVLGDRLYGGEPLVPLPERQPAAEGGDTVENGTMQRTGLHAWSILIHHPVTGEQVSFQAPYPQDFETTLSWMRGRLPD